MAKITYTNKVALNELPSIADINKVKAGDMNEIKSVVNENADIVTVNETATSGTKLLIESEDLDFQGSEITNEYSESIATGYSANYTNGLHSYSTTEQRVGTWIDDKPIYRKVIDLGVFPNNAEKTVAHNIANIDVITKVYTFGRLSNGLTISLGYYDVTTPANSITIMCNKTNVVITTKNDRSSYTGYTILEYTKTTD